SDSGDYTCRGQSSDSQSSEISDAVTLTVSGSPKAVVSVKPDTHVFIGETVTLRCDVQGGGSTQWSYSWFKDNIRLYEYGGNSFITEQQISIRSVGYSDSGYYTCSGQLSEISDAVTLTVSAKPK
ncbi:hypothetical protein PDJAM_G00196480, partial [Pangasius djambal]|nr:hypothetical protein [Pangasius djambal]